MKTYLVRLTPQEPYFFGNEKTFLFKKEDNQGQRGNSYYIRSERTPLQSTLMGMMRYLLMPFKDYSHPEENAPVIGSESFQLGKAGQSFGVIRKIHPLFLMKGDEAYVATPLDCKPGGKTYQPFGGYKVVPTADGEKLFTPDYNPKKGLADSYMRLSDGALTEASRIFGAETRVGNLKATGGKNEKGFFKKEYVYLRDGFCFAFYAELDDSAVLPQGGLTTAFLGQGKSLFTVSLEERENTLPGDVQKLLPTGTAYCLSDVFTDASVLNSCRFAIVETRDYRAYITGSNGKIQKDSVLYKLIRAGSVFIVSDKSAFAALTENADCQQAGFNCIVSKEEA